MVRFPRALTDDGLPDGVRRAAADAGVHVAGDWVAGESRLDAALLSGLGTADRLGDRG